MTNVSTSSLAITKPLVYPPPLYRIWDPKFLGENFYFKDQAAILQKIDSNGVLRSPDLFSYAIKPNRTLPENLIFL